MSNLDRVSRCGNQPESPGITSGTSCAAGGSRTPNNPVGVGGRNQPGPGTATSIPLCSPRRRISGFGDYVLHRCPHCGKQIGPGEAKKDRTGEGWCRVCRDLRREVEQATRQHKRAHELATLWDNRRRQCARNLTEASNRLRAMRDARLPVHLQSRRTAQTGEKAA